MKTTPHMKDFWLSQNYLWCIPTTAIETIKNKETTQYLHDLVTLKNNKYNQQSTRYGLNAFRYCWILSDFK
jgi:hypothetical protein